MLTKKNEVKKKKPKNINQTGKNIYSHRSKVVSLPQSCATRAMFDWTALGIGSSDREGHTDNAADKPLIIIYSTAYDGQNQWRVREELALRKD